MTVYSPPVDAMRFALMHAAGFKAICGLLDKEDITVDMVEPILQESARFAREELAALNRVGDKIPPVLNTDGVVVCADYKKAYQNYVSMQWGGISFPTENGGQNLPQVLSFAVQELWQASSLSFGLVPLLNHGAIEALLAHGTPEQKKIYAEKLISGEWAASMDLTEASAGSDLSTITTRAERNPDGNYNISGQKIFITYGDHDLTENIVHMVLARVQNAPEGAKGLSLFIVPKFKATADGKRGDRNAVSCSALEHKMGIHATPTCVMQYDGAEGYLIGEENHGLEYMFTMMNNVRLLVGIQSVGVMERAFQAAQYYAKTRVQGKNIDGSAVKNLSIAHHPDVKRMLFTMRCAVEVSRCLTYYTASGLDLEQCDEAKIAERTRARKEMLIPIAKAWCSDMAVEMTSLAVQIHGGGGYIEETGVPQFYRDARVLPIYEGTNGIQSMDFALRKVLKDKGKAMFALIAEMEEFCKKHLEDTTPAFVSFITQFQESIKRLHDVTEWVLEKGANNTAAVAAGATPFLKMAGIITAGYVYARAVVHFRESDQNINVSLADLYNKLRFYGETFLPQAIAQLPTIKQSYQSVLDADFS